MDPDLVQYYQSWCFTIYSTARIILRQVLSIVTYGIWTIHIWQPVTKCQTWWPLGNWWPPAQYESSNNEFIFADLLQYKGSDQYATKLYCIVYVYSAQYLHILQDSKRYLTNPTVQVQPQLTSNWHSPYWKIEAQGWLFINILEVL